MAIARQTDAELVKPLRGHIVRRHICGGTVGVGELVTLNTDTFIDPTNTTSSIEKVLGVAVTAGLITETIDVVVFGPIQCLTGATVGATVYGGDTAGEPVESAGSNLSIAGYAESATVLFVQPTTAA